MHVRRIDPDRGYRTENLWLPKRHLGNLRAVKNSLTFPLAQQVPVHAYDETEHHLIVPREYIPFDEWDDLGFDIEDRAQTQFPKCTVRCNAVMRDAVQREARAALLESGNGIVSLACGKGKTVISISAWCELGVPALIVVHTKDLMDQWVERLVEFTSLRDEDIGVYQGATADWEKPVCIAMIQTLATRAQAEELPDGFERHFGVVIYDEVHHLGAPYFNTTAALGRGLRWGLSATPDREDGLDALYQGHIGPVLYQNLEQDIIPSTFFVETGVSIPPDVWPDLRDRTGETNIPKLLTWLAKHERRNAKIVEYINYALDDGRKVLCLSSRVDHLDELAAVFGERAGKIHGRVLDTQRKGVLNSYDLIFASTQIAKEGLDRKDLDTIMLLLPVTREGMFRQILGRIQRMASDKLEPAMIVFEDGSVPICLNMCRKLRRHLTTFKYPFHRE